MIAEPLVPYDIRLKYREDPEMVPASKGPCNMCAFFVRTEGGEPCCGVHGRGCPSHSRSPGRAGIGELTAMLEGVMTPGYSR
jgi:hypothetical protein